jgi:hypothetical protein
VIPLTNCQNSNQTEYVRVIDWFIDKYLLMIWKESLIF